MLRAVKGHQRAVGCQQAVQGVLHGAGAGSGGQGQDHAVEGAAQGKGVGQGALAHPEGPVAEIVRHGLTGPRLVDVLGRHAHAHDAQARARPVHGRLQDVAGHEPVGLGKGFADHDLVRAVGLGQAAQAQMQTVDLGPASVGKGQDQAVGRFAQAGQVQGQGAPDARLQGRHAVDLLQARPERVGSPLEVTEDMGQAVGRVVFVPGRFQGQDQAAGHDHDHEAAGHDQGHGSHLALHAPEVAQELAAQGAHPTTPAHRPGGGSGWCGCP